MQYEVLVIQSPECFITHCTFVAFVCIFIVLKYICVFIQAGTQLTMKILQVVVVLVTHLIMGFTIQTEYFVTPNEGTPCPALPCHTLSHYLENTKRYFTSNTRISFLHGVHKIYISRNLWIKNVSNLVLTGYNASNAHAAKIVCVEPASLIFINIENLVIKHLSVFYCGYPIVPFQNEKKLSSIAVFLGNITSLKLLNISVENSTGFGVVGKNVFGNSLISHSTFMFNNYYTTINCSYGRGTRFKHTNYCISSSINCSYGLGTCRGGNMYLHYEISPDSAVPTVAGSTSIDSCVFTNGVDITGDGLASGLGVYLSNAVRYKMDVSVSNVVSTRNMAERGANFNFKVIDDIGSIKIINVTSSMANYLLPPNKAKHETGFEFFYDADSLIQISTINQTFLLHISDSKFYDNIGVGINIIMYGGYSNVKYNVIIKNCLFQRNLSPFGSSARLVQSIPSMLEVLFQDTNFTDDMVPEQSNSFDVSMSVYAVENLKIVNCIFAMNQRTVLQAFDSTLYFGGDVIFSGNNGTLGGAMTVEGCSRFYLMPHTHIQISNNHARRGGGIYIVDQDITTVRLVPCFFQLLDLQYPISHIDTRITLENNTADEAGSAVYGGRIDQCWLFTSSQVIIRNSSVFTSIFKILDSVSNVSQVSSNPIAVHLCKHMYMSSFTKNNFTTLHVDHVSVYPGQRFKIPVVLYGQRNGSVPGTVRTKLINKSEGAHIATLQETQNTEYLCTNLTYTIFSTGQYELMELRVDGAQYYEEETHILVKVTLLPCPLGFQLSNFTAQCECAQLLKDKGLLCNISGSKPLVQRTQSVWISINANENETILHDNCPLDYCKTTPLWLQLDHSDEQCAHGHSGVLCGRCKSNLSLAIGTSKCLECTNTHLALLLPFALAGLMLVIFLIVCNLTVSMGTINGLIFYANIVRVNHAYFFVTPKTSALNVFQRMLAIFIAWLNLDLGIETCFISGMEAYIQTWLQFAFPFYIWMIIGVIIYLSRRSITIVRLVGSSAVSVLATLFLLSYAKLQRTVITAFSFTYLQNYYTKGRSLGVWLYDGNVPFLQGKHIALFVMALSVSVFFILPFTLLLLFAPCIQASSHFLFKWVKMKVLPLLDAYQAPYKDKFRFWTGLTLVVRSILLVGYGLNILGDPDINHLLTVCVLAILLCCTSITGIVYKNTALNILEISFILNLLILSGWTVYNRHASNGNPSDKQSILVSTSTGVAFTTFICIIFYHTYLYLKSSKLHQCFKRQSIKRGDRRERGTVEDSVESAVDGPPHRPPTMTVIELRESLLTDN